MSEDSKFHSFNATPRRRRRRLRGGEVDEDDDELVASTNVQPSVRSIGGLSVGLGGDGLGDPTASRGGGNNTVEYSNPNKTRRSWTRSLSPQRLGSRQVESSTAKPNVMPPVVGPTKSKPKKDSGRRPPSSGPAHQSRPPPSPSSFDNSSTLRRIAPARSKSDSHEGLSTMQHPHHSPSRKNKPKPQQDQRIPRMPSSARSPIIGVKHNKQRIPTHTIQPPAQKPHSERAMSSTSSSHHVQRLVSDPGNPGDTSGASSSAGSSAGVVAASVPSPTPRRRSKDTFSSGNPPLVVDKIPLESSSFPASPVIIERRNLDKETLQNVEEVKDSIRKMRTQRYSQRQKAKFEPGGSVAAPSGTGPSTASPGGISKSNFTPPTSPVKTTSVPRGIHPTGPTTKQHRQQQEQPQSQHQLHQSPSIVASPTKTPGTNPSVVVGRDSQSSGNLQVSSSRFLGEITVEDLDVGYVRTPSKTNRDTLSSMEEVQQGHNQSSDHGRASSTPAVTGTDLTSRDETHQQVVDDLIKSIKKTKKLIKRTSREVWTERDEVVHLQRTNWSLRKALLQGDAPVDSITTLNLKLEKTLRKERELVLQLEVMKEEKQQLDAECSRLALSIGEFNKVLDALNARVVPLLPPEDDEATSGAYVPGSTMPGVVRESFRDVSSAGSVSLPKTLDHSSATLAAAAAMVNLLDEDDYSESLHSTEDGSTDGGNQSSCAADNYANDSERPEPSLSLSHLRVPMH